MMDAGPYREMIGAARLVPPPTHARRVAVALTISFLAFVLFALLSPWRQNVTGEGRVIAYTPLERQQNIEAPVSGRVVRWHVQEGSVVRAGDPIVDISDNDPRLMERLEVRRAAQVAQLETYAQRVAAARAQVEATERGQRQAIRAAEARLRVATQSVEAARQSEQAAEAALDTARLNLARQRALEEQGLASQRQLELAILAEQRASTSRESARARLSAATSELAGKQADLERARADADSAQAGAGASLQAAVAGEASARASLASLESQIARQESQQVTAPRDGTIFRLVANQGGEQVSAGDTLAILVPDTLSRAVEVWVDGNDAAIIEAGRPVRIQFEGWPAVQFAGWPSVAVGTFGGRVAFVDSTDDGQGNFRVVVVPQAGEEPWPEARFLRQGTRVNAWVLLRRVTVGFELWRQLNGFPPSLDVPPTTTTRGASSSSYGGGYGGGGDYGSSDYGSNSSSYGGGSYGGGSYGGGGYGGGGYGGYGGSDYGGGGEYGDSDYAGVDDYGGGAGYGAAGGY
ncbi:MAG: HlyD family efflux transporter periplasmic adaptor subunit [Sandaracinaceae bacterium]